MNLLVDLWLIYYSSLNLINLCNPCYFVTWYLTIYHVAGIEFVSSKRRRKKILKFTKNIIEYKYQHFRNNIHLCLEILSFIYTNENENIEKFCKTLASRITDSYLHFYFVSGACWKNVNLRKMQSTLIYCMPFHNFAYERACKHEKKVKECERKSRCASNNYDRLSLHLFSQSKKIMCKNA